METAAVRIETDGVSVEADLTPVSDARGMVIFVHGSGSSRFSPRNRHVARVLNVYRFSTILADLLTPQEEAVDRETAAIRFDIPLLARRTTAMIDWAVTLPETHGIPIGLFGASTGAAAAVIAAAARPDDVRAVVSRGGRVDLAEDALEACRAPLLMIVGERDEPVERLHWRSIPRLQCEHKLVVVPGAGHLFEEPGALDRVSELAAHWFERYLVREDRR